MSAKARRRFHRRDRRKCKASGWKRWGKSKSAVVGHGAPNSAQTTNPHLSFDETVDAVFRRARKL